MRTFHSGRSCKFNHMPSNAPRCLVVDYGIGNFQSVLNMLRHLGIEGKACSSAEDIHNSSHVILPGVGSFDRAMKLLREYGWVDALREYAALPGTHLLGICLGAQLLGNSSQEGTSPGIGLLDFDTVRFSNASGLPIPHMKWNSVSPTAAVAPWLSIPEDARFYFAHSFFMQPRTVSTYGETQYGVAFASVLGEGNVVGFQFHPEKSHRFGKEALRSFVEWH